MDDIAIGTMQNYLRKNAKKNNVDILSYLIAKKGYKLLCFR